MKKFIIIGIPVVFFGGLIVWRYGVKKVTADQLAASVKSRGTASANAVLAKAGPREIKQTLVIVGDAASPYNISISPKVTGVIVSLNLREGDSVHAGQVVATMDTEELNGVIAQDQAAYAEAEQRYTQAKLQQAPTDVGVMTTIEQQRANVASTEAEYNQSRVNYQALAHGADATVVDAKAKTAAAESAVQSAQASVQSAQANVDLAQATYNRDYTLYKQAFIAAQDVDQARTTFEVQKAALNVAQKAYASAESSLRSTKAEEANASDQASIVKLKGVADVQAAKALWTQAQATLTNAHSQLAQIPAYVQNLQALKSTADSALGIVNQAKARLLWTNLTSPIDGIVTARNADPGAVANPGAAILQVQFLKWLYLTGAVPVEQSSDIHVGMPADIVFDALPTKHYSGVVSRVNPSADPTNRQFMIYVQIQNPGLAIRPGMFAKFTLVTSSVQADVVVPREAVRAGTSGQSDTVIVIDDKSVAHIVPVKEGVSDAAGYQILSGVAAGQNVVVQTYTQIKDGQKVSAGKGGGKGSKSGGAGQGATQSGTGQQGSGS